MSHPSLGAILPVVALDAVFLAGFVVTFLMDVPVVPWVLLACSVLGTPMVLTAVILANRKSP